MELVLENFSIKRHCIKKQLLKYQIEKKPVTNINSGKKKKKKNVRMALRHGEEGAKEGVTGPCCGYRTGCGRDRNQV